MENQDSTELPMNANATDSVETSNHFNNGTIVSQVNGVDQLQMENFLSGAINSEHDDITLDGSVVTPSQRQETRQLISNREVVNLESANLPGL